ncbi:MAG: hypothetical protein WDA20_03605 [Desulfuromonadales bacterium]
MAENDCTNPEQHCDMHACQLKHKDMSPKIQSFFDNPRYACTNCGAKTHDAANLCKPKPL